MFPTSAQRADLRLLLLCIILGITSWTGLCRLLRGEALKLRELDYVQAAHAFGVSQWRIMLRHILPNVMHIVLISVVMDFSGLVLAEAVLSYVGVGVDPSMISFGTMINARAPGDGARTDGVVVACQRRSASCWPLVLSANLFADAVRDAFDPRVRVGARKLRLAKRAGMSALLEINGSQDLAGWLRRDGARRRRRQPAGRARRDLRHGRRIGMRQVHDRAVGAAAAAGGGADRRRLGAARRRGPARPAGGGDARRARAAHRDDLPGARDEPESGAHRRAADRRGAGAAYRPARRGEAQARAGAAARRSASRIPRGAWANIRSSCPAA